MSLLCSLGQNISKDYDKPMRFISSWVIVRPASVLSFYVLLKSDYQSECLRMSECRFACMCVFMCVHLCTFIVRAYTRSLSEHIVPQQEHIMIGPFVWTDTIIQSLSFPTSPPFLFNLVIFSIKLFTQVPITLTCNETIYKIITLVDHEIAEMKMFFPVSGGGSRSNLVCLPNPLFFCLLPYLYVLKS